MLVMTCVAFGYNILLIFNFLQYGILATVMQGDGGDLAGAPHQVQVADQGKVEQGSLVLISLEYVYAQ